MPGSTRTRGKWSAKHCSVPPNVFHYGQGEAVLGDGGMLGFGGVSGLQMLDYGSYNVGDPQCHGYSSKSNQLYRLPAPVRLGQRCLLGCSYRKKSTIVS